MLDIKFLRENPDIVKENIKKKFQDHKLVLVDEVRDLDEKNREVKLKGDELRMQRNSLSSQIGVLMKENKKSEAEEIKKKLEDYKNDPKHNGKEFMYDVSTKTIEDLCQLLQCQPQDIMDWEVELDPELSYERKLCEE